MQVAAEAVERGRAEDGGVGLAGDAGDQVRVAADVGGVLVELVGEELFRAAGGVGEEAFDEAELSQASVKPETNAERSSCPALSRSQKLVAGLLAAYLAIQLFFPLRHYLYPGNVSWTEEGHNFAWHMKLRTKVGEAVFTVTDPRSGQTWTIDPENYLKSHQLMKMITKPDLVVIFAHYLAEEKRREGYDDVEVRARVMVSLNGRQPQLLIDPNVDLAREQVSLLPARYIMPLTTPLSSRKVQSSSASEYTTE